MWTCHFTHATKANEVGVVLAKGVNKGVPQQQQQQEYQLFVQLQVGNKRTDMWQSFLNGILLVKGNLIEGLHLQRATHKNATAFGQH